MSGGNITGNPLNFLKMRNFKYFSPTIRKFFANKVLLLQKQRSNFATVIKKIHADTVHVC